jgi:hypothetical protein
MRLTPNQISAITEMLHEKLQFFDERGSPANGDVLNDIEKVLHNSFNTEADGTEERSSVQRLVEEEDANHG